MTNLFNSTMVLLKGFDVFMVKCYFFFLRFEGEKNQQSRFFFIIQLVKSQ